MRSKLWAADQHEGKLTLKSGRVLEFIPTPYLHAPGALCTYDRKTRSLFTSDLFGAISSDPQRWSLFARDEWLSAMTPWHQEYMPTGALLRPCMERLELLEIERVLPQHGSVIEGAQVRTAIESAPPKTFVPCPKATRLCSLSMMTSKFEP